MTVDEVRARWASGSPCAMCLDHWFFVGMPCPAHCTTSDEIAEHDARFRAVIDDSQPVCRLDASRFGKPQHPWWLSAPPGS